MTSPTPAPRDDSSASAQTDEKWDAYPETLLEFCTTPALRIDLREPVRAEAGTALRALGLGAPFGVFTAENPAGANADDAPTERDQARREHRNEQRAESLEGELTARGIPFVRVDGVSPDGEYREHCVATLTSREEATALARRYAQLALFWFDGNAFWLLPGIATKPPRRLP